MSCIADISTHERGKGGASARSLKKIWFAARTSLRSSLRKGFATARTLCPSCLSVCLIRVSLSPLR